MNALAAFSVSNIIIRVHRRRRGDTGEHAGSATWLRPGFLEKPQIGSARAILPLKATASVGKICQSRELPPKRLQCYPRPRSLAADLSRPHHPDLIDIVGGRSGPGWPPN